MPDVPQDKATCERFDFPLVISGHDHHRVDAVYHGTRLVKAGHNADYAIVVDITWESAAADCQPTVTCRHVKVSDSKPDAALSAEVVKAYVAHPTGASMAYLSVLLLVQVCAAAEAY